MSMIGYGSTLGSSATEGGSYTNLANVIDNDGPSLKADVVPCTNQDSANRFKEKFAGLGDGGQTTFNVVYKKANLAAIYTLFGTTKWWKLTYPDAGNFKCEGFISEIKPGDPLADLATLDVTIEWTGKPTFATS